MADGRATEGNGRLGLPDVRVAIQHEGDIVIARQKGRELAVSRGFSSTRGATFYFTLDGRR